MQPVVDQGRQWGQPCCPSAYVAKVPRIHEKNQQCITKMPHWHGFPLEALKSFQPQVKSFAILWHISNFVAIEKGFMSVYKHYGIFLPYDERNCQSNFLGIALPPAHLNSVQKDKVLMF